VGTDRGFINCEQPDGSDSFVTMRYDNTGANSGNDDCLKMAVTTTSGESQLETSANTQVTEWQHIAMTWSSGELIRFHINGVEDTGADRNNPNNTGTLSGCSTLIIGAGAYDDNTTSEGWDGLIDDVRIYNRALTAEEIKEVMRGEPDLAWNPSPANRSTPDIAVVTPLSWSPGDKAAQHDVYFGTDGDAVADANASDTTGVYRGRQSNTSFTPAEPLEWGTGPYYWRIDEINTDGTISKGRIWSFTVANFLLVDDFEKYTDNDPANEAVWQFWIDGYADAANGSQMGNAVPPYMELSTVQQGKQAVEMFFNNTGGVMNSEVELPIEQGRDWTRNGVEELSLWFHGQPASDGSFVQDPVGTFTITSKSGDIWGQDDEFHYGYKMLTGAGEIIARIDSVTRTAQWTKCGVMIRETLEPGSKYAAVYVMAPNADGTPTEGVRFQARTDTDIDATSDTSMATQEQRDVVPPYWVKLERDVAGNFRGYYSSNGTSWTPMSWNPQPVAMESTVFVGLALTSNNTNQVAEAKISNVTITGNVTGQWTSRDIGIAANAAEPMYVGIANATGVPAIVPHPDPSAATIDAWTEWRVPLSEFADKGINLTDVRKLVFGLGSKGGAASGGSGSVFLDNITLQRSAPQPQP
ncbi:MAG: LamG domain-containing protein, partial [Phycisphaerales bacterium]